MSVYYTHGYVGTLELWNRCVHYFRSGIPLSNQVVFMLYDRGLLTPREVAYGK